MTPSQAIHAIDVLARIRQRLEAEGGWLELHHLARMSVDELELIVAAEVNAPRVSRLQGCTPGIALSADAEVAA